MKKIGLVVVAIVMACVQQAAAQGCSVCTKTAQGLGEESAKGLNTGILYLALLPLAFMSTLAYLWWRYNRNSREAGDA